MAFVMVFWLLAAPAFTLNGEDDDDDATVSQLPCSPTYFSLVDLIKYHHAAYYGVGVTSLFLKINREKEKKR